MDTERRLYRIGEVARLSGLPVKTIRFYSDRGLVPPADRSESGYRLYGDEALARLDLVRSLRELGAGLPEIERVLTRELDLRALLALQLEAVETQIRSLRLRRDALRVLAAGDYDEKEVKKMTKLTQLSNEERRRMVHEFLDEAMGDLDVDPGLKTRLQAGLPELPDEPTPEQVEAWIEFAELLQDREFRARIREMSERGAQVRASGEVPGDPDAHRRSAALVAEKGGAAVAAGTDPASPEGQRIAGEIAAALAAARGDTDSPELRARLADQIETATDRRAERYWQLLAIMQGREPMPSAIPAWEWAIAALRAS